MHEQPLVRTCKIPLPLAKCEKNREKEGASIKTISLLLLSSTSALQGSPPNLFERNDVQQTLQQRACAPAVKPLPRWQDNLYDAGLILQTLHASHPLQLATIAALARKLAKTHHHHGYSYGLCPQQPALAWISSLPAPAPLQALPTGWRIPLALYQQHCKKLTLDFAPLHGKVAQLSLQPLLLRPQQEGVLSLTCYPVKSKKLGPQLWFLLPTDPKLGVTPTPFVSSLAANTAAALPQWINRLRQEAKLTALQLQSTGPLQEAANLLTRHFSLEHNRRLLRQVGSALRAQQWLPLGENRVIARSVEELAWLLWFSPRHRSLILHPAATHLALSTRTEAESLLLVLVLASAL